MIDILVNNAGLHGFKQRITAEGFSEMIAVNYLAPWLLTRSLKQVLVNSDNARVVNVASRASRNHGELNISKDLVDVSDFTAKESSKLYGKTKLLDIMFSAELARQLEGTGVKVNAVCPGFNVTGLGRELGFSKPLAFILNLLKIGDPHNGADIILSVALNPEYAKTTGGFFAAKTGEAITLIAPEDDIKLQKELWLETKVLLDNRGLLSSSDVNI